ncbi:ornithine cyclodeaminase family protein [Terrilactibacillus sp. S3-3]|nr:ornithine cyclodeaminase family protein [Terrilactibacillus sp. S3-3]
MLLMPCFSGSHFATKLVTVFPQNSKRGLPVTQGIVLLNDNQTGEMLAILDGTTLTALRTGAASGVAIRYLSNPRATSAGLIGTGTQGKYQLLVACEARNLTDIYLFNRTAAKIPAFIEELRPLLPGNINIRAAADIRELAALSDIIIITATTSQEPLLPDDEKLLKNKLVIGIGSYKPNMHEFSPALYSLIAKIYVDTMDAIRETGDLITPLNNRWIEHEQIRPFAKIVCGKEQVTFAKDETHVFKSVGMALFDLFTARLIFNKAKQLGLGQSVRM